MIIEINNLIKTYNKKNVVDINSFRVDNGDFLGLVGNNGAGKTTLFRMMVDLVNADGGEISLSYLNDAGEAVTVNPALSEDWKKHTGTYIDEGFLIDFLTPEEYFLFLAKVSNLNEESMQRHIDRCKTFMAGEILGQKKLIRNLSAGNKHKVGIVAALLSQPQLLILDEPFNFLDPTSQNVLKDILTEYNRETNATILLSSHNLAHTVDICTRIALLEHGVIINDLKNENGSAATELEQYFTHTGSHDVVAVEE
ncbi:MAG: ABC transporter ATP-binding protein [Prevotella sp.]|uniref:ABC transporter ATP-binding protein n=1 Tax=Prevotella sp. TaxID=59823 RepID=UPI002A2C3888|nr:ABC transporter ATP-binding protein [Prevotella sp.]MDD7318861.1 ABC transporter ATP-binding protein [Prevotellaceae bacterium]MDY4019239.1 ABC transporter ATP-binding protein [Prevotella sp.]